MPHTWWELHRKWSSGQKKQKKRTILSGESIESQLFHESSSYLSASLSTICMPSSRECSRGWWIVGSTHPTMDHGKPYYIGAVHILLGASITTSSLDSADAMLRTFYRLMPRLYPLQMCTANVHSLVHIVPFVRLWGPLCAFSMFGCENMNGVLKNTFHGTRKVLDQLVFTVTLRQSLPFITDNHQIHPCMTHNRRNMLQLSEHVYAIGKICQRKLTSAEKAAIGTIARQDTLVSSDSVPAIGRVMKDRVIYHSLMHSADAARNNCVCTFQTQDEPGFALIDYFWLLPPFHWNVYRLFL